MTHFRQSLVTREKNSLKQLHKATILSYGNDIEKKANESFDNGVFFEIEAKRTRSIV
jgi:hypothetical protein